MYVKILDLQGYFLGVIYLPNYRKQCHFLLHLGLWLAVCPLKPQMIDFLSPTQETIVHVIKISNDVLFCCPCAWSK